MAFSSLSSAARSGIRLIGRSVVFAAAAYALSSAAQVSVGAAAAASAPGASSSANGGTGGVGLGGVGQGVTINPGVNSGAGINVQGRNAGNNALNGPRARSNADRELPAVDPQSGPQNSGQRALALDQASRVRQTAPARDQPVPAAR